MNIFLAFLMMITGVCSAMDKQSSAKGGPSHKEKHQQESAQVAAKKAAGRQPQEAIQVIHVSKSTAASTQNTTSAAQQEKKALTSENKEQQSTIMQQSSSSTSTTDNQNSSSAPLPSESAKKEPNYPVYFFEEDIKKGLGEIENSVDKCIMLASGSFDEKKEQELKQYGEELREAMNKIRPRCTLQGVSASIAKEQKLKGYLLDTVIDQEVDCIGSDIIKKIKAWFDIKQTSLCLKIWQKAGEAYQARETMVNLGEAQGLSLAINPLVKEIYIGCQDGKILVFDALEKKIKKVMVGHNGPVYAIRTMWEGKCLISRTENRQTFVWSIDDDHPRIELENTKYSKDYIFDKKVVRSHWGKSYISYFDTDGVYDIPLSYLQNQLKLNSGQASCLYLVYYLYKLKKETQDSLASKVVTTLYNCPYVKNFDTLIQKSLMNFLDLKAKELGIKIEYDALRLSK